MIDLEYIPPAYQKYVRWVDEIDVSTLLEKNYSYTRAFFDGIPEDRYDFYYAPGKWSVKEVLQHLIDVERVFAYRALRFSRLDPTDLPGFDENYYIETSSLEDVSFKQILREWSAVRESTIFFYRNLDPKYLDRSGRADGNEFSVRSIAYILGGHSRHHVEVIKDKYL